MITKQNSLFHILLEHENIENELYENGGELTPELEAQLAINKENAAAKLEGYGWVIQEFEMEIAGLSAKVDYYKQKAEEAKKMQQGLQFRLDKIKQRVLAAVEQLGDSKGKYKTATWLFGRRKSQQVHVDDKLPLAFHASKFEVKLNNDSLLSLFNGDVELVNKAKLEISASIHTHLSELLRKQASNSDKIAYADAAAAVKDSLAPDKNLIKKQIKAGVPVQGAKLVDNYSLTVK